MTFMSVRINKYLADRNYCTRREADTYIEQGLVLINDQKAALGSKVEEGDRVQVLFKQKSRHYYAYNKPRGIITHSPQEGEKDILESIPLKGVFPIGRLDKDSEGLIILTDDGRITDKLLNPEYEHEKEYVVTTKEKLVSGFQHKMERGVDIEEYVTKPAQIKILSDHSFSIVLTEGKKHQIRRMCAAVGNTVDTLKRTRVMNIKLGTLKAGEYREITGAELQEFLKILEQ
ncbi:MAG TPA: pseudouridine synthase [Candidatus Paceibacterota bacterium]|nr:pseudouridine synthase [Candidatus Paceibacterota bacterium]